MSERRCDVTGNLCGTDTWGDSPCRCVQCALWMKEPQEGAPVRSPRIGDSDGGVPSCDFSGLPKHKCSHCGGRWDAPGEAVDSPELADIRHAVTHKLDRFYPWQQYAETLLRMVDELTTRIGQLESANRYLRASGTEDIKERDDLRAKLSATNAATESVWVVVEHDGRPYEFWTRREDVCEPLPDGGAVVQYVKANAVTTDNPEFDATDGAHPAWWRGHDYTAKKFEELVADLRAKLELSEAHDAVTSADAIRHCAETNDLRAKLDLANITIQMGDTLTTQQLEVIRELRAKLAEAARIHVESEAKHAYRVKELEAKLAEAEETRDVFREANERSLRSIVEQRERAEAAEARAKALEETVREMHRQRATVYTPGER